MIIPFLPFLAFAVASSVTPGPNNVMVAAAAANFGIRRTAPMMLGIALGFASMIMIVGLGLAAPMALYPQAHVVLRWVGIVWMLYLAWKIANAGAPGAGDTRPPLGVVGAWLFQWVNPKAWLLALAVAATWTTPAGPAAPQLAVMALIFFAVGIPSNLIWAGIGAGTGRLLHSPARLRVFNVTMALLLVASVLPLALGD